MASQTMTVLVIIAVVIGGIIFYNEVLKPILAETKVYVTVYSDSTLLQGVEVNLSKIGIQWNVHHPTNDDGIATFYDIESGDYYLSVMINNVWKGANEVEIKKGVNYFTFKYYPNTNSWEVA